MDTLIVSHRGDYQVTSMDSTDAGPSGFVAMVAWFYRMRTMQLVRNQEVSMTEYRTEPARRDDAQEGMYQAEHWLAWLAALVALVLGIIGLLRGFGIIGGGVDQGVTAGSPATQAASFGAIWDGVVWLLPAIALGMLSMALHRADHHRMHDPELADDADEALWKTEHALAWLMALLTIATVVIGILTGFDVFGRGNDQPDALPWLLAAILCGTLTSTLHAVRHHQMAEEDYILRVVERRAAAAPGPVIRPADEYGTEPRP